MNKARMGAVEIGHDGEYYRDKRRIVWKISPIYRNTGTAKGAKNRL